MREVPQGALSDGRRCAFSHRRRFRGAGFNTPEQHLVVDARDQEVSR